MNRNGMGPDNRGMGTGKRRGNCFAAGRGIGHSAGTRESIILEDLISRIEALEKKMDSQKESLS